MIASMRLLYQIPVAYCKLPDRDENSEAVRERLAEQQGIAYAKTVADALNLKLFEAEQHQYSRPGFNG